MSKLKLQYWVVDHRAAALALVTLILGWTEEEASEAANSWHTKDIVAALEGETIDPSKG